MSKVLLGDVAAERRETCKGSKDGYPTVGLEHLTPEEITLTSWDDSSGNTFTKMFHKGDVLFGRRRAYLKKLLLHRLTVYALVILQSLRQSLTIFFRNYCPSSFKMMLCLILR